MGEKKQGNQWAEVWEQWKARRVASHEADQWEQVGAAVGETVGGSTVEGERPGEAMGQGHPRPAIFE